MYENILKTIDHTLLTPTASWQEVQVLCDDALAYQVAAVCLPPSYVKRAKAYMGDKMAVCTVVGFPNGYQTTAVKCFETREAIADGADEIDLVINLGDVKNGDEQKILAEIEAVKAICAHRILKVIIEACYLTTPEKMILCRLVSEAGADFIKTSTGFGSGGAILDDIHLFRAHIGPMVQMKAAGGIKSLDLAEEFLALGVTRLGSSSLIKMVAEARKK